MVVKLAQSLEVVINEMKSYFFFLSFFLKCVRTAGLEKAKCLIVLIVGLARDLFIKNKANSQML